MAGAGSSSVSLTYTADIKPMIADLKKGLASVSGMTEAEARKWAKSVDDSFKKIAKGQQGVGESAKNAEKNVQGMGASLRQIGTQMPDVVTQLGGGADAMQVIVQQGGQVIQQMMATGGAMGVVMGPIGLLTAGLAALGVAYVAITQPIEREIEAQKALGEINRSTEATHRKLEAAYIDQAVALGSLTEAQGRQMHAQDSARQAVLDFAGAQKEQRKEIADTIESSKSYLKWTERLLGIYSFVAPEATKAAINAITGWDDAVKSGEANLQGLASAVVRFADDQKELKTVTLETADATDKNKDADKDAGKAARERAAAVKELQGILDESAGRQRSAVGEIIEARDKELRQVQELAGVAKDAALAQAAADGVKAQAQDKLLEQLDKISARSQDDIGGKSGDVLRTREAELKLIDEIDQATAGTAETEAARSDAMARATRDLDKIRSDSVYKLEQQQVAAHEKEMKRIKARRESFLMAGSTIVGSLAGITEAIDGAEGATDKQRMAAFKIAKGFAIAQAIINTAQGITSALALPIGGRIAAGLVAAAGAVQVAIIRRTEPSFHQGGMDYGLAPDEIRTQRKTGVEGTLIGRGVRAVGGPAGVEAANKGQAPGGGAPRVIAVLTPPGAPARLLRDATRSRAGAALVQDAARPSALRVRR